eukprot:Tbor_TRINITY_DN5258_c1_g1::TRINITY_DN5258_c1_g1_i1::g.16656::m.16656
MSSYIQNSVQFHSVQCNDYYTVIRYHHISSRSTYKTVQRLTDSLSSYYTMPLYYYYYPNLILLSFGAKSVIGLNTGQHTDSKSQHSNKENPYEYTSGYVGGKGYGCLWASRDKLIHIAQDCSDSST